MSVVVVQISHEENDKMAVFSDSALHIIREMKSCHQENAVPANFEGEDFS